MKITTVTDISIVTIWSFYVSQKVEEMFMFTQLTCDTDLLKHKLLRVIEPIPITLNTFHTARVTAEFGKGMHQSSRYTNAALQKL